MRIAAFLPVMLVPGALGEGSIICFSDPPLQLVAGSSNVSVVHEYPFRETCQAVLQFMESDVTPITYSFNQTIPCSGPQVASFLVPQDAPNGSARVIWQCAESATCSFAEISGGLGDRSLAPEQNGTVECMAASLAGLAPDTGPAPPTDASSKPTNLPHQPSGNGNQWGVNATIQQPQPTASGTTGITVSDANRLTPSPAISWSIFTVTQTVTSLMTTFISVS